MGLRRVSYKSRLKRNVYYLESKSKLKKEKDVDLETVKYDKKGAVALISFNRPEVRNAFNARMTEDILEALIIAKNDKEVRSIVLTGEGLSFSAGADLSSRDNKW